MCHANKAWHILVLCWTFTRCEALMTGTSFGMCLFIAGVILMPDQLNDFEKRLLAKCRRREKRLFSAWLGAIKTSPRLARHCPYLKAFPPTTWAILLSYHAEFFNMAPIHKFSTLDWYWVLLYQSQFIGYCPCVDEFNELQKELLVKNNPHLVNYFASADSSSKK